MRLFILLSVLLCVPSFSRAAILDIQEVQSKSGVKAWLIEDTSVDVISVEFLFKGAGARNDPENLQGLTRILSNTMDEGAGNLNSTAFQRELSQYSIGLSFVAGRDDFSGSLKTLAKYKDKAFSLLSLAVNSPRFDDESVRRMIDANKSRILNDKNDPDWMAARIENDVIYQGHPYALNTGGTLTTLEKITPVLLKDKWKQDLTKDRLIVAVVGHISKDELATRLDQIFSELPETSKNNIVVPIDLKKKSQNILYKHDMPQSILSVVGQGVSHAAPDYFTVQVLNQIWGGGGFGSRLTDVIREKRGLTYGIYSSLSEMDAVQTLSISTSAQHKNIEQVIKALREESKKIQNEPVPHAELSAAKSYLAGSALLQLTSTDKIADMILSFQKWGLPANYLDIRRNAILKVSPEDIQAAAKKYLDLNKFTFIIVGQPDGFSPDKIYTELPNVD